MLNALRYWRSLALAQPITWSFCQMRSQVPKQSAKRRRE